MLLSEGCSSYVGVSNLFTDLSIPNSLARVHSRLETVLRYSTSCLQTCEPPASVLPVLKSQVCAALLSKTAFDLAWLTSFLLVF